MKWTRAELSSEIFVQFVVVDLGGTPLRVGNQLLCRFAVHPRVERISPALKHDLPLGEVAVHVVDGRDPVPGGMGQAHLDPAIIELGAIQARRKRATQVVNAETLKLRIILADTLHNRVDYAVERGVADGRVAVVSAGVQVSADAEHGAERRQDV